MNRLSTQGLAPHTREARSDSITSTSMSERPEVDQRARALAHRLEMSKERLVADLGKLSTMLGTSAGQVGKRFVRMGLVLGGLLLLGIVAAVVRRRRRVRVRFL